MITADNMIIIDYGYKDLDRYYSRNFGLMWHKSSDSVFNSGLFFGRNKDIYSFYKNQLFMIPRKAMIITI